MLSEDFKNKVKTEKTYQVKSILSNYLVNSREEFLEALNYAKANMINLIDKFDDSEEPLENNSEKWTKAYFNKQKIYLMTNFSDERIEHLLQVARKLFPENRGKISNKSISENSTRKKRSSGKNTEDNVVPNAIIAGGTVVTVVGLLTLKVSLITIGVIVVAGGAVYKYKKDN